MGRLVVQRARSLHQRLAGQQAAGQIGRESQGLGGLLGVQLPAAVYDERAYGVLKTAGMGAQGIQQGKRLHGHAAGAGGEGEQDPPPLQRAGFHSRKLCPLHPGAVQSEFQQAAQPGRGAGLEQNYSLMHRRSPPIPGRRRQSALGAVPPRAPGRFAVPRRVMRLRQPK